MLKTDYVGPVPGANVVYVVVGDKAKFDQINRPVTEQKLPNSPGHVLSKTIGSWDESIGMVIFQHWVELPDSLDGDQQDSAQVAALAKPGAA